MHRIISIGTGILMFCLLPLLLASCSGSRGGDFMSSSCGSCCYYPDCTNRIPQHINTHGKKVVVVDPSVHAWGAYGPDGNLIKAGLATAGGNWCPDIHRPCRTAVGEFTITSLGSPDCKSHKYPLPRGGGLMPYCMFFHNGQSLHGSPDGTVIEANVSHGCVRMSIPDAAWVRYNFANVGTKVIVRPYAE